MKAVFSSIKTKIIELKLASVLNIISSTIMMHLYNKCGVGLDVSDVHDLFDLVMAASCDTHDVGPPLCFELPSRADGLSALQFNQQLVESSESFHAPIVKETTVFLSVSSSHTTAIHNATGHCLPHPNTDPSVKFVVGQH